jgi:hypothetical protein
MGNRRARPAVLHADFEKRSAWHRIAAAAAAAPNMSLTPNGKAGPDAPSLKLPL